MDKDSDSVCGENIASKDGDSEKNIVFESGRVPLHYIRKVVITMNSILSCEAHHVFVCEQAEDI